MAQRKARLPIFKPPQSNGDNDRYVDYVTRAATKYTNVGGGIVQMQEGCQRQPKDYENPRSTFDAMELNPGVRLKTAGTKLCSVCGLEVDVKDFTPDKRKRDGLDNRCRFCEAKRIRVIYWQSKG